MRRGAPCRLRHLPDLHQAELTMGEHSEWLGARIIGVHVGFTVERIVCRLRKLPKTGCYPGHEPMGLR